MAKREEKVISKLAALNNDPSPATRGMAYFDLYREVLRIRDGTDWYNAWDVDPIGYGEGGYGEGEYGQ